MPLFAVLALKDSAPTIDAAVPEHFPHDSYEIEPGKWVVNADVSTSKELAIKLGIRDTVSHLVLPVRAYTGRAQPDLWEWLAAQTARQE